jgi:hypothetical protein
MQFNHIVTIPAPLGVIGFEIRKENHMRHFKDLGDALVLPTQ